MIGLKSVAAKAATSATVPTPLQWPIIKLAMNVSPKNKTAASHVVHIHTHVRFPRSKKMVDLLCSRMPYKQEML